MQEAEAAEQKRADILGIADIFQWSMIGMLALGSVLLWWGTLNSLIRTGGFEGVVSWLTMGVGLAVFQVYKLRQILTGRLPQAQRRRLRAIQAILNLNIVANLAALLIIYAVNPIVGRFYVTAQDIDNFLIFLIVAISIGALVDFELRRLREPRPLFWLAVVSRVIPQATLIFSAQLAMMPATAITGVLLIGGQRIAVVGLEYKTARKKQATKTARDGLRWTLLSDALNVAAALLVLIVWLGR